MNRKERRRRKRNQEKKMKQAGLQEVGVVLNDDNTLAALAFKVKTRQIIMDKELAVNLGNKLLEVSEKMTQIDLKEEEENSNEDG